MSRQGRTATFRGEGGKVCNRRDLAVGASFSVLMGADSLCPAILRQAPSVKSDRLVPALRSAQGDHKDHTEADHRDRHGRGELSVKVMAAIIEARDLVKRFDGFTAVDHISFAVEAGVIFGFLGPNGAARRRRSRC